MPVLERVKQFVQECNSTNSSLDKIEVIRRFPDLQQLFKYVYDEINFQYGVTSKNIIKLRNLPRDGVQKNIDIFQLLIRLNDRLVTGHDAIKEVWQFMIDNPGFEGEILDIIDRNLKTRTDAKLINKIYPKCIETFPIELADDYSPKVRKKIDWDKQVWLASRKMDGIRLCVKFFTDIPVLTIGRSGKEFFTLDKIKEMLRAINLPNNIVFDGEVCKIGPNGEDDFQGILSEIRKKNHTIENPRFKIFNLIPLHEFDEGEGPSIYLDRFATLNSLIWKDNPILSILEQTRVKSDEHLEELKAIAAQNNWEGLILRRGDRAYEATRTTDNLIKVKAFKDAEYVVLSTEMGPIRFIDKTTGLEKEEVMLTNVMIEHKGNPVSIGSGFKLEQRQQFFKNPELIIGKVITVKYFNESMDSKTGKLSLRFPTCKAIHGDRRET